MKFTYTEKNGDAPIEEWLIPRLKEHAKSKFGMIIDIEVKEDKEAQDDKTSK